LVYLLGLSFGVVAIRVKLTQMQVFYNNLKIHPTAAGLTPLGIRFGAMDLTLNPETRER